MIDAVFRFNQFNRDRWVSRQAERVPNGACVLDVGAGPCRYAGLFRRARYVALDVAAIEGAVRPLDVLADIGALPFADASIDFVLCTEVLEHVPEPIQAVAEMARVLRRGGRIAVTAPLGSGLHQMPHHYYGGFTPAWYRAFLPRCGFRDVEIEPNGGFFKHYGQESQRFSLLSHPRSLQSGTLVRRSFASAVWAVTLPVCRLLGPLVCHWLDPLDETKEFTVGYHVTAIRS